MKQLLLILGFSLTTNLSAQTDTVVYQYRINIKDITSKGSSSLVQEPLKDLFKTTPTYQETLETFIFESHQDVCERDVIKVIPNFTIRQFKKLKLN